MILQAKYLFILYNFNLIFFISSSPLGCISSTSRSSSSNPQPSRTRDETIREITHTSSSPGPSTSRYVPQTVLINEATTDTIIDNVMRMYNSWYKRKKFAEYVSETIRTYNAFNNPRVMANFIEENIRSVTSDYSKQQDVVKITLVVYIAAEYFYNLSLRDIWIKTAEGTEIQGLEMEHQKFEIEIQEPIAVIKQKFHDLITSYSEAVGKINGIEIKTKTELENWVGSSFVKIMFNLADTIDKMINFFYILLDKKINEYKEWGVFTNEQIRLMLYRYIGDVVKESFFKLRQYLDNSNIGTTKSQYYFGADIYSTPLTRTVPGTEKMPSISESEESLWNTVNSIRVNNDMHAIQILSECERRRYGETIYPLIEEGQTYEYPEFSLMLVEVMDAFYIVKAEQDLLHFTKSPYCENIRPSSGSLTLINVHVMPGVIADNFNLIFFTSSFPPPGCGHSKRSTPIVEYSHNIPNVIEEEPHAFSDQTPLLYSYKQSRIIVNSVNTTNTIIDNIFRMYEIWAEKEKKIMSAIKRGHIISNPLKEDCVLTQFIEENIISDHQNPIKITFVVYIASEYFYSLFLCDIWNRTTQDNDEGIANEEFENEKEKNIFKTNLNDCGSAKYEFYNLITPYSKTISQIKSSQILVNELNNLVGSFVEIMFSLADTIDKMSNISFELDEKINKYKQSNKFCDEQIRFVLYRYIGDAVYEGFSKLRRYLDNSNIEKGEYDFRATILPTPYKRTTPGTEKKPSISTDEILLWQNVVNLYSSNNEFTGISSFRVLSECEILRYGKTVYPPAEVGQEYIHPKFFINWEFNKFFIYVRNEESEYK